MLIEHGGSEQGETPKVREASDTTQPDQAALEKKEKMRDTSVNITGSGERSILIEQKK
jgi:hypothetical protein